MTPARRRGISGLAYAALLLVPGLALPSGVEAAIFGKPGDTGQIEFVLENETGTGADALTVQFISRVEPANLADRIQINSVTVKENQSAPQPISIPAEQSRTFVVDYTITDAAQDGEAFNLVLSADFGDQVSLPDPAGWDTSVTL